MHDIGYQHHRFRIGKEVLRGYCYLQQQLRWIDLTSNSGQYSKGKV
jgi:hypothetical protein